jgi:DNA-binding transcriptional ArsR family regulator
MDNRKVPWPNLCEYLLRVSSCQSKEEFMRTACLEVQALIPFDATANILDVWNPKHLGGISPPDVASSFNNYYRYRMPPFGTWELAKEITNWQTMGRYEFAVDFMWPQGCWKSLNHHPLPRQQIFLSIHRSRRSSNFLESDIDTLGLVDGYLNSLFSRFDKRRDTADSALSTEGIAERFPPLSSREAEICSLVARRLNTTEIAMHLFISRRTVEKHVESIFEKLYVRSRAQLRWRLGVTPPTGNHQPLYWSKSFKIT